MNRFKTTIQVFVSLFIILSGCSEKNDPQPLTYSKMLTGNTSKTWRLTGYQIVEAGRDPISFPVNDPSDPDYCLYDDLYTFYADEGRTLEISQGDLKCLDAPNIYYTGNWAMINATATLNFASLFFGVGGYTIKRLTEQSMTLELYVKEFNFSYRLTFTAQQG